MYNMPKSVKYSFLEKNESKNIIERMDNTTITPSISCPANSYLDTVNKSPQPQQKPCHCIGTNKWIPVNGSC